MAATRKPSEPAHEPLIAEDVVAERLDVSTSAVQKWRAAGKGPPHYRIGGRIRYRLSDVEQWITQQRDK